MSTRVIVYEIEDNVSSRHARIEADHGFGIAPGQVKVGECRIAGSSGQSEVMLPNRLIKPAESYLKFVGLK